MIHWLKRLFFLLAVLSSLSIYSLERELPSFGKECKGGYLYLPREKSIDRSTYLYVKYALEFFREQKVSFVCLDLDTPGGEVFAALRISEELRKMDEVYGIPVIAYVDSWALSAGALLAYSCRYIGASPNASMGAAEPVVVSEGKMETASEKMVSALRVEFAKTAEIYGRDPLIAEAMVDKDVVLVFRKGEIVKLLNDQQIITKGKHPDIVINAKGKLLTLNAKEMQEFNVADFTASSFEKAPFLENISYELLSYKNWKITFFSFLSNPYVSSLLMMGLMICLYAELQNPSFGFFAILGLSCLSLILLSAFATEVIHVLEILFLSFGLIVFLIDLFWVSGFGFLAVIGLFFFLFGLVTIQLPPLRDFSLTPSNWGIWMSHWINLLALFLGTLFLFFTVVLPTCGIFFRKSQLFKRLVLEDSEDRPIIANLPKIGSEGITLTALRPFGKVEIDKAIFEAGTEGEFLEPQVPIKVIAYSQKFLIVQIKGNP